MFFSGIADEAGKPIAVQIEAQKAIGWRHIEIRTVDGVNLTDLSEDQFEAVHAAVSEAGLAVSCFASQLANWARPIAGVFELDRAELDRAIPRMRRFGTRFIRCMSWPNASPPWPEPDWRAEVVKRMRVLARAAEAGGVVLVHENCDGWAGQGPAQTLELLREVDSPALRLVFDTGNPVHHDQDGAEYYRQVREHIAYVHIKDYHRDEGGRLSACFPGEGLGHVREIVADLLARGYDGGLSIEPHLAAVIHLAKEASDPEQAFRLYVDYGKRLEALVAELRETGRAGRGGRERLR